MSSTAMDYGIVSLPDWFKDLCDTNSGNNAPSSVILGTAGDKNSFILNVKEWEDEESRQLDGFKGTDFCHGSTAPVRILKYFLHFSGGDEHAKLTAPVVFTPRAESGRGYCHGGSMCAVMDDAIGWMGFAYTGVVKPWVGFTVQVNTTLKKPVSVGSVLRLDASVERLEGERKVWIKSSLVDPADTNVVFCTASGLFLIPATKPSISSGVPSPSTPSLISPSSSTTELSSSTLNSVG